MTADDRRLLEVLAASEDGCTDALLTADGFKLDVLISIVSAGLATARPERTFAAGKPVERTRVRITEAGLGALSYLVRAARGPVGGKGYRLGPSCLMRDRFGRQ
jgi:hypothetical protein